MDRDDYALEDCGGFEQDESNAAAAAAVDTAAAANGSNGRLRIRSVRQLPVRYAWEAPSALEQYVSRPLLGGSLHTTMTFNTSVVLLESGHQFVNPRLDQLNSAIQVPAPAAVWLVSAAAQSVSRSIADSRCL
jgi:hypothetical protein